MTLTPIQTLLILLIVASSSIVTRFLPFVVFTGNSEEHPYTGFLGKVLPNAVIGLLVVYCLKAVNFQALGNWLPEVLAIGCIVLLHSWKRNTLLSIAGGTIVYMFLVQTVFG